MTKIRYVNTKEQTAAQSRHGCQFWGHPNSYFFGCFKKFEKRCEMKKAIALFNAIYLEQFDLAF